MHYIRKNDLTDEQKKILLYLANFRDQPEAFPEHMFSDAVSTMGADDLAELAESMREWLEDTRFQWGNYKEQLKNSPMTSEERYLEVSAVGDKNMVINAQNVRLVEKALENKKEGA